MDDAGEQLVVEITPSWCETNGLSYNTLLAVVRSVLDERTDESN